MQPKHTASPVTAARTAIITALLTALTLAGCATNATVSSNWLDESKRNSRYDRVLVIAMAEQGDKRMSFEDAVAFDLRSDTTQAWPSSRHMATTTKINADTIAPVVRELGATAVVISRVSKMEVSTSESKPYTDVTTTRKKGTAFRYDYVEKEIPILVTPEFTTELETDVVDVASGERIYSVVAAASGQESLSEVINVLSAAIAKRLRSDGVIR
jgi:DNA-binding transcriptional regulator YhcF (GntR family)